MKLKELDPGVRAFRTLAIELSKSFPAMKFKAQDAEKLELLGSIEQDKHKGEQFEYRINLNYDPSHQAMYLMSQFPKGKQTFRMSIEDAIRRAGLKPESSTLDHNFFRASFHFLKDPAR